MTEAQIAALPSTAMHEAAHAVVACRLGLPLTCVRIGEAMQDPTMWGCTHTPFDTDTWTPPANDGHGDTFERLAAMRVAGMVAEMIDGRPRGVRAYDMDMEHILADVRGASLSGPDFDRDAFLRAAISRAYDVLFGDGGAAWSRVAAALLERHFLLASAVAELVNGAPA